MKNIITPLGDLMLNIDKTIQKNISFDELKLNIRTRQAAQYFHSHPALDDIRKLLSKYLRNTVGDNYCFLGLHLINTLNPEMTREWNFFTDPTDDNTNALIAQLKGGKYLSLLELCLIQVKNKKTFLIYDEKIRIQKEYEKYQDNLYHMKIKNWENAEDNIKVIEDFIIEIGLKNKKDVAQKLSKNLIEIHKINEKCRIIYYIPIFIFPDQPAVGGLMLGFRKPIKIDLLLILQLLAIRIFLQPIGSMLALSLGEIQPIIARDTFIYHDLNALYREIEELINNPNIITSNNLTKFHLLHFVASYEADAYMTEEVASIYPEQDIELCNILKKVKDKYSNIIKNLKLRCNINVVCSNDIKIRGKPKEIEFMFDQLIRNSIAAFIPNSDSITENTINLSARKKNDIVQIKFSDTAGGISDIKMKLIKENLDNGKQSYDNMNRGLTIIQQILAEYNQYFTSKNITNQIYEKGRKGICIKFCIPLIKGGYNEQNTYHRGR